MEDRGPHWLFSSIPLHFLVNFFVFVCTHVCGGYARSAGFCVDVTFLSAWENNNEGHSWIEGDLQHVVLISSTCGPHTLTYQVPEFQVFDNTLGMKSLEARGQHWVFV